MTGRSVSGENDAFSNAVEKAQKICNRMAANGSGECAGAGKGCLPNVSVQDVTYHWRLVYTSCDITFRCPCECLDHVAVIEVE